MKYGLARFPESLKNVVLDINATDDDLLLLSQAENLTSFSCGSCRVSDEGLSFFLSKCAHLKHLHIPMTTNRNKFGHKAMKNVILKPLNTLHITYASSYRHPEELIQCSQLTSLKLGMHPWDKNYVFLVPSQLQQILHNLSQLEDLTIFFKQAVDHSEVLSVFAQEGQRLQRLEIVGFCKYDIDPPPPLFLFLSTLQSLTHLSLPDRHVCAKDLEMLVKFQNLRTLVVFQVFLDSTDVNFVDLREAVCKDREEGSRRIAIEQIWNRSTLEFLIPVKREDSSAIIFGISEVAFLKSYKFVEGSYSRRYEYDPVKTTYLPR